MGALLSRPSLEENLRTNKAEVLRSIRELDRERSRLESEEKRVLGDIKAHVKRGEMASAQMLVKDYVRVRQHKVKFLEMRSQLQAVNLRLQAIRSTRAMSESIRGVTDVMTKLNSAVEVPMMQQIMRTFMKENVKLGLTEEMLSGAMDDLAEEVDDEDVIAAALAEVGLEFDADLCKAPEAPNGRTAILEDISERLRKLNM